MECYSALIGQLRKACPTLELREDEPMRLHTTFRVGGPARLMALPKSEGEATAAVCTAAGLGIVPLFMGNGSNLLVADEGLKAFVVKTCDGLVGTEKTGEATLTAGSGVKLSRLAGFALEQGLSGLEFAHGIPGTLGGGVTMNAGAYGGELCQVVGETTYLTAAGTVETAVGAQHDFAYRHSAFSDGTRLILSSTVHLAAGDRAEIKAKMDDLAARRRQSQPLEFASAGSTFRRPEGHFAAALIDACGLKGTTVGGAQVSEKHGGFLINRGDATCRDILQLIDLVRERVLRQTGVTLELEVRVLP